MAEELNFVEEIAGDHVKVVLSGEVDIYTSQELKENLYRVVESNKKDVIIDCKELNYIDSTGLGIFVGALKKQSSMKKIKIINLKDNIKKLFIITGLDKIFEVE